MALAAPILTNIDDKAKIFFAQSPIHFNFANDLNDATIAAVSVEVYIWRGFQSADLPAAPSVIFPASILKKISPGDKYIALELHNEIKAFIASSNLNKNNPQYAYNTTGVPTTTGEGVYFHIVYQVKNQVGNTVTFDPVKQLGTFFATSGYRYSFEQKGGYYTTYEDVPTFRKYANSIVYDRSTINRTTQVATSQSGTGANGMITQQSLNPTPRNLQTGVKCLIAYVNRIGVWDTFTPFGRVVELDPTQRDQFSSSFRNPLQVNAQIQHLQQTGAPKGRRTFQINTGLIDEKNNYQIRELKASGKIYLILFGEEVFTSVQTGTTVDSTTVSVDNTTITVDSATVTTANLGFYSNPLQLPVIIKPSVFTVKTRLNDKSSISYTLELEETNNFINDIL